jgi:MFS family permease
VPRPSNGVARKEQNPIDEWWNRTFPPYSLRRYLFALAVLPAITALVALYNDSRGRHWPFAIYAFASISAAGVLGVAFLSRGRWEVPARERPAIPAPLPPTTAAAAPQEWRREFVVGLPICVVGMLLFLGVLSGPSQLGWLGLIGTSLAAGTFVSFVFAMRRSVLSAILVSLVAGFGVSLVLQLFDSVMGSGGSFLGSWVLGSLVAALFVVPAWLHLKDVGLPQPRPDRSPWMTPVRIAAPAWVTLTGGFCLAIGAAIVARLS